jgi:hypothetical protein
MEQRRQEKALLPLALALDLALDLVQAPKAPGAQQAYQASALSAGFAALARMAPVALDRQERSLVHRVPAAWGRFEPQPQWT